MNRNTFNQLFGEAKGVLKPTPIRDGKLWKYCSEIVRDVPCISKVEGQGLQIIILHVTDCDRFPNFLSRDACYILGVLKPCYTVENSTNSGDSTVSSSPTVNASNKGDVVQPNHFFIRK